MKKLAICFVFILTSKFIFRGNENNKIDSLLKLIKTDQSDTSKISHLSKLASELMYSNPDSSILFSNYALDILNHAKNLPIQWKQIEIGNSFHLLGTLQYLKGNYSTSLDFYFKALAIWDMSDNFTGNNIKRQFLLYKSKTLGNIGVIYDEQGDYLKALDYYFKSLKLAEELKNKKEIASKLGNIGLIYKEQANELPNKSSYAFKKDSLFQQALNYYFRALSIDEKLSNKIEMTIWSGNIAIIYDLQHNYSKAFVYYFQALKIAEQIGDKKGIEVNLNNIGSLYIDLKKYNEAFNSLYHSLLLSQNIQEMYDLQDCYLNLSNLYEKSNISLPDTVSGKLLNMEKMRLRSLYFYKRSIEIRDILFSQENKKQLVQKEMTYEFEKKEAITKAENDKKIALAKAENRKKK